MVDTAADDDPVLRMSGDVDIATESEWRRRGAELLAAHPDMRDVTVDVGEVGFLDSRGMAVLVHLHTSALARGGQLRLTAVSRRIARALSVSGLDQIFALEAS
jgi:anti-sigma B factor antagonist